MMAKRVWILSTLAAAACSTSDGGWGPEADTAPAGWQVVQHPEDRVATIEGLSGPESVRYDADQDVWFVGNFNGGGGDRDSNGFVSRVSAETGEMLALRFATGTGDHPLHAPRGMFITGDTLWVADIDGVHGFHRGTGEPLVFVDFRPLEPGFLNDIAQGPGGALYVTDTDRSKVYRLEGRTVTLGLDEPGLGSPNGITWDPARENLVLVPWEPGFRVHTWTGEAAPQGFGPSTTPGRLDGVEAIDRRLLLASQSDSSLHLMDGGGTRQVVRTPGAPADIGVDTRRRRVAVPYIALNRVDIWQLPRS